MHRRNAPLFESGTFAKYGDCSKRDKSIGSKILRPFPVARTQIVELVLLLNLKLYTVLVLTWLWGCRLGEFVSMVSYFDC